MPGGPRNTVRFGVFELDPDSGELLKHGMRVKLADKPFQILVALLERPQELITRKELQERLWPGDTFVEFEHGLNNAISRLRETLGDTADNPRFIQTIPKRGYRFIAPVEQPVNTPAAPPVEPTAAIAADRPAVTAPEGAPVTRTRLSWVWFSLAGAAVLSWTTWLVIERVSGVESPVSRTLAVLPFEAGDATDGSADSYVAFGMTEALITELSRVGALKVISQTSVMQYKGQRKPLKLIASELGAGIIVEGSVLREGDRVRITVQLIDARSDTHLWAQSYAREPGAGVAGPRPQARAVAGRIRSRVAPAARPAPPRGEPANAAAAAAYVKARYFMLKPVDADFQRSREYFEQAIAADPNFAPAHVGLSNFYGTTDAIAPEEAMPRAKASALRALEIDDNLAAAHAALAYVNYFWDWDWAETERRFARAVELDPNDSKSRRWRALFMSAMGRSATAIEEIQHAIELDPVSVSAYDAAGAIYFDARQYDKVIEVAQRINDLSPNDPRAHGHWSTGYLHLGRMQEAVEHARRGLDTSGRDPVFLCLLAGTLHRAGLRKEAEQTFAEVTKFASTGYVPEVFLAIANLWMRGPDAAVPWLRRGYERRDGYVVIIRSTPWFDAMRDHPGYRDILKKMNFPG